VAFAWNGEKQDNFDIYVKMIGTNGPPLRLTTDAAQDYGPAWSPDGRFIAFLRDLPSKKTAVLLIPAIEILIHHQERYLLHQVWRHRNITKRG
jgi:dipeptidyl aminopeptidase/acylaminoacyl peptidase